MGFIEEIASYVIKHAPQYNICVHSPIIAQAILESASGTSELATKANNYFGLKYNQAQPDRCPTAIGYYVKNGSEQNEDGSYTTNTMYWQKFRNMEDCVIGYFDFINTSRYANLKGVANPKTYLELIKADGYATSLKYVDNLMRVIESYNLTQYDGVKEEECKMRINIHAGHNPDGKVACGAIGFIKESTENRNVKNEVIRQLKGLGHEVYDCTVENGTSKNNVLTNIVAKCNKNDVDLDVSIHFNAGASDSTGNGKTTGTEVYVYSTSSKAKAYADRVVSEIAKLGFKNRGVKVNTSLYVLRKTLNPAMLIECCFVDDKDDVALYDYKSMADAIVKGICGKNYKEPIENTEEDKEASKNGSESVTGDSASGYRVQVGYYCKKENAEAMQKKLKAAGFGAIIVKG